MKAAITLLTLVASVIAQLSEFEEFQLTYNKVYKDEKELQYRLKIFKLNKIIIDEHNKRYASGLETFEMGVNQFTDLSPSEFKTFVGGDYNMNDININENHTFYMPTNLNIPRSVNWVKKGAVTDVRSQGSCGCCWAFAAVATLEGQYFRKYKKLVEFSEQNLLDCSSNEKYQNSGCAGGSPWKALKYVRDNHGIQARHTYIYEKKLGKCRYVEELKAASIERIRTAYSDEHLLAATVAEMGPLAILVDAAHYHYYKRGVLRKHCRDKTKQVPHSLAIVGYGYDSDGLDYWLMKNSWGSEWGENGYVRMARNANNMCFLPHMPIYPVVK